MQYIEIRTNPEYKYNEVLEQINSNFSLVSGSSASFSGGTISGTTNFLGQILSGGTDLYSIFATTSGSGDITRVQPGTNIITGGTSNFPIVSLFDSPSINNLYFSGTATGGNLITTALSGTNIFSGSTNLSDLFSTLLQFSILESQISTKANLSGATFTGTVIAPSLSATTLSGGTILSGSTNLYSIFSTTDTNDITRVQPGSNITTGGTANEPTVNLVASPSVNNITFSGTAIGGTVQADAVTATSLSAATLSGGTILSGSTNLYSIFSTTDTNDITRVQSGLNTYTGGTENLPTVNISAATLTYLSATTISGGTLLSGSTNLNEIFSPKNTIGGFGITIDGASAAITSGIKGNVIVPFSGQIQSWEILSNVSGNTSIDVLKSTFSTFSADTGTTITGGDYISLSSNYKNINTNLSAWTVSFNAGDIFTFQVLSANTISRANILIKVIKYN